MKNIRKMLSIAAAGALLSVSASTVFANEHMVQCQGVNGCKGQGSCKSAANACKNQNACKGQGFLETTAKECATMKKEQHTQQP